MSLYVPCVCRYRYSWRPEGVRSPRTGVTGSWEHWELNHGPLQNHHVFLITEATRKGHVLNYKTWLVVILIRHTSFLLPFLLPIAMGFKEKVKLCLFVWFF